MSVPHTASIEGSFDPYDTDSGEVRVARDDEEPSRQTLYLDAPGMGVDERTTYWLTADADDFCDLSAMR